MKKVRWGVLGAAKIALQKVIPAMQASRYCEVIAIGSRSLEKAQKAAARLGIPLSFGSYEELLARDDIDAVYIPLPNHLHVPWSIRALRAGKHVLCEKPIALSALEAKELLIEAQRYPQHKIMEAFMYRFHPQWQRAKQLVENGEIGELRTIHSFFSYYNVDVTNIRNQAEIGGGGLMDIGCYGISLSRFIFAAEPLRVCGIMEFDPQFQVDRLTSAILEFPQGIASLTCATQLIPYQRVNIFGTKGRIEIEIPFNAPPDRPCKIWLQIGNELKEILFPIADQYTIQGDLFSLAILNNTVVPTPLADAVANMQVLDAVRQSAQEKIWIDCLF
ncbi:MAG: Gfo/Idh/MocA family oxidoreductase [candidate division KSB1 bacterium]|nr:Gfo/Idh/MocA family oxidoreductase [candidate division KSB1 bacterium]MDZ7358106.1 Gfo/Idh/MocA family oxidoreductase [candidate division KSB1 bacterium]